MNLAEQIAWEHRYIRKGWSSSDCSCDPGGRTYSQEGYAVHIATVTERTVRERVAAEIEYQKFDDASDPRLREFNAALDFAIDIASCGPTLEIHAWGATPEQADAIFTAAMGAAYDAAPEGVAVDAVGKLTGHTTEEAPDDHH